MIQHQGFSHQNCIHIPALHLRAACRKTSSIATSCKPGTIYTPRAGQWPETPIFYAHIAYRTEDRGGRGRGRGRRSGVAWRVHLLSLFHHSILAPRGTSSATCFCCCTGPHGFYRYRCRRLSCADLSLASPGRNKVALLKQHHPPLAGAVGEITGIYPQCTAAACCHRYLRLA